MGRTVSKSETVTLVCDSCAKKETQTATNPLGVYADHPADKKFQGWQFWIRRSYNPAELSQKNHQITLCPLCVQKLDTHVNW